MKVGQIAVQLYTLRDLCKTAADLASTAARVRAIGYTAVQLSRVGPIAEEDIVAIMKDNGLVICATHEPAQDILNAPQKVVDRLGRLGCRLTAFPNPGGIDLTDERQVEALVGQLDAAGACLRAAGLTLGYHNHAFEFVRFRGAPVLEYIYARTNPQNVVGELDTYWLHYGGGDVVDWCRKLRGRLPFIHLKDYCYTKENKPAYCEIGQGTLPFDRIIPEAEASGCRWFIVEQDTCPGDPFDSLKVSFDHLASHLCT
jgi:sugar phosphate isomerase/epimerase